MKYVVAFTALLFMGCNSQTEQVNTNDYAEFDSIIAKSEQNLTIVSGANKKSDSLVTGKVEKTVKKIKKMENEIKQLKADDAGSSFSIRAISDN
jgi:galactokinase/mevalonate kinase-like predicted kinase